MAENQTEVLSDKTLVGTSPWGTLKFTLTNPDFDREEFMVSSFISSVRIHQALNFKPHFA